ncbi:hypothetical protein EVAR_53063_1 [Eumeta japonica]|uniref:Uncharacterized protein n=1 Tax=Eumeta variegata TaxID=151549 RepID=A0A4C1YXR1_EUMVA|nr:hypothetical protein EVAR_53063_1 [Eumeta japonica]
MSMDTASTSRRKRTLHDATQSTPDVRAAPISADSASATTHSKYGVHARDGRARILDVTAAGPPHAPRHHAGGAYAIHRPFNRRRPSARGGGRTSWAGARCPRRGLGYYATNLLGARPA